MTIEVEKADSETRYQHKCLSDLGSQVIENTGVLLEVLLSKSGPTDTKIKEFQDALDDLIEVGFSLMWKDPLWDPDGHFTKEYMQWCYEDGVIPPGYLTGKKGWRTQLDVNFRLNKFGALFPSKRRRRRRRVAR